MKVAVFVQHLVAMPLAFDHTLLLWQLNMPIHGYSWHEERNSDGKITQKSALEDPDDHFPTPTHLESENDRIRAQIKLPPHADLETWDMH